MIALRWAGILILALVIVAFLQLTVPKQVLLVLFYFVAGCGIGFGIAEIRRGK